MEPPREPDFFTKSRYFKYSSYLWSYLDGKATKDCRFTEDKTTLSAVMAGLREITDREKLYDPRNVNIIVADHDLERAIDVKSLHLTELPDFALKQLRDSPDPMFQYKRGSTTRMIRHPGEVCLRRFHPYKREEPETRSRPTLEWNREQVELEISEVQPAFTSLEIKMSPEPVTAPGGNLRNLVKVDIKGREVPSKSIFIEDELLKVTPYTRCEITTELLKVLSLTNDGPWFSIDNKQAFTYEYITRRLSSYLQMFHLRYFDERNTKVCNIPSGDVLETAFKCNHFHKTQITSLLRENIKAAYNIVKIHLNKETFNKC
jgi:hypothetical protein